MTFFTNLTLRGIKKSALTHAELDNNFVTLDSGLSNLQNQINSISGGTSGSGGDNYWTSGSTGLYSVKTINDSGLDATGDYALAEGFQTLASGDYSHAGGKGSTASGDYSFVHGSGSTASGNTTIVLGSGIIGTEDNTVYVDKLNVKNIGTTTPLYNLGVDNNGNIVSGTTNGGSGSSNLTQDLTVQLGTGVQFGGVSTGQVFSASTTSLEQVLRSLLIKTIPPTYTQPSISMTNPTSQSYEIGTSVPSVTVSSLFTQNDAGPIQTHRLFKTVGTSPETEISSNSSSAITFNDTTLVYLTATTQYRSNATYSDGNIKNDNLGNPYPSGRILSGTTPYASYRILTPVRRLFYGGTNTTPTTSSDVRSLPLSQLNPANGTSFTITSVAGTNKITFAYPATLRNAISIIYNTGGNVDASGTFTQTTVSVDGANNLLPTNYKVYTYTSLIPFTGVELYTITI